jgi:hypothetical protein
MRHKRIHLMITLLVFFVQYTPSSAPSFKPNAIPFIGNPQQDVIITNTFFNPVMLEIEMVEYDEETLAYALFSNQTKSLEDGIYTIYNFGNQIYNNTTYMKLKISLVVNHCMKLENRNLLLTQQKILMI